MTLFEWVTAYSDYLIPMALALLGGFVRALHSNGHDRSWAFTAVMVVTAAFTGAIVFSFLQDYRQAMPKGTLAAITGIAGFLGTDLLRAVSLRMMRIVDKWGLPEEDHSNDTTLTSRRYDHDAVMRHKDDE